MPLLSGLVRIVFKEVLICIFVISTGGRNHTRNSTETGYFDCGISNVICFACSLSSSLLHGNDKFVACQSVDLWKTGTDKSIVKLIHLICRSAYLIFINSLICFTIILRHICQNIKFRFYEFLLIG